MIDASRYIGLPFRDHGRTRDGLDCWGLARLVYAETWSIFLPDFGDGYPDANDEAHVRRLIDGSRGDWREVPRKQAAAGDLIWLHPAHLGVMIDHRRFIHAAAEVGRVRQGRVGDWGFLAATFWRHASL